MGWHVHYQVLRDTPLAPDELTAIANLNLEAAHARVRTMRAKVGRRCAMRDEEHDKA